MKEFTELSVKIIQLEKKRSELENWMKKNIDSPNFDEVARDYRAVLLKINTCRERKDELKLKSKGRGVKIYHVPYGVRLSS